MAKGLRRASERLFQGEVLGKAYKDQITDR
jgi:hypothetical protein